jgi:hypothetical protein
VWIDKPLILQPKWRILVILHKTYTVNQHNTTITGKLVVSINDLRDNEFAGVRLGAEEKQALSNYDLYRIQYLNSSSSEEEFSSRYIEMQAKANLSPYTEFLKPPYSDHSLNS